MICDLRGSETETGVDKTRNIVYYVTSTQIH